MLKRLRRILRLALAGIPGIVLLADWSAYGGKVTYSTDPSKPIGSTVDKQGSVTSQGSGGASSDTGGITIAEAVPSSNTVSTSAGVPSFPGLLDAVNSRINTPTSVNTPAASATAASTSPAVTTAPTVSEAITPAQYMSSAIPADVYSGIESGTMSYNDNTGQITDSSGNPVGTWNQGTQQYTPGSGNTGASQVPTTTQPQVVDSKYGITSSNGMFSWTAPNGTINGFSSLQDAQNYASSWGSGSSPSWTTAAPATSLTPTAAAAQPTTPPIPVTTSPLIANPNPTPAPAAEDLPTGMGQSSSGFTVQGNAPSVMPDINTLAKAWQDVYGATPPGLDQYLQSGDVQQALQGNEPLYMASDAQFQQFLQEAIQNKQNQQAQSGS